MLLLFLSVTIIILVYFILEANQEKRAKIMSLSRIKNIRFL